MKRIIASIVCVSLLFSMSTMFLVSATEDVVTEDLSVLDELSIDDDFADDCVLVVVDSSNSKIMLTRD